MAKSCNHLKDILNVERKIIEEHIENHKWYKRISDKEDAIVDFVHKFAWLMREVYCSVSCPEKDKCEVCQNFRKGFLEDISDGEIREYIRNIFNDKNEELILLQLLIIKNNIKQHKWLRHINNYEQAVKDFLDQYGWLVMDIYHKTKVEDNGN